MNTVRWMFVFVTYITVIASYYTMISIFDFDFVKHSLYKKIKYILWGIVAIAWIANILVLKNAFSSDIMIGTQFIIQLVFNVMLTALPMAIFAFYVNIRLCFIEKKNKC